MKWIFSFVFILVSLIVEAQKITYAKTINDDVDCANFEILGNTGNNFMIYKRVRWKHMLVIYDKQMRQVRNKRLSFIPDEAFKVDFVLQDKFVNVIYQFQRNTTVYCFGVKVNELGEPITQPVILDTTVTPAMGLNNRYFITNSGDTLEGPVISVNTKYFVTNSENRDKILLYKVTPSRNNLFLHTKLFDSDLTLSDEHRATLPSENETFFYSPIVIDNKGTFFTIRSFRQHILQKTKKLDLLIKYNGRSDLSVIQIPLPEASFSQVKIAIDNLNKQYVINSLFSSKNSQHIDGLFTTFISADSSARMVSAYNLFSDSLRKTLNPTQGLKGAFDNLILRNITLKKDGGFRITAEDCFELIYRSSKKDKSKNLLSNFFRDAGDYQRSFSEYFPFPKLYTEYLPEGNLFFNNMLAIDVDSSLKVKWNTVIYKNQVGAESFQSFGTFATGSETHFLFTGYKAPKVIHNFALYADGASKTYAPFKTNAAGYTMMPQNLKQVGGKQVIIPAFYRGILSFALVDFSQALQSEY